MTPTRAPATRGAHSSARLEGWQFWLLAAPAISGRTPRGCGADSGARPWRAESPYGESKLMVERMLNWYAACHGMKSVSLRYFNAAGASFDGRIGEDWTVTLNLIPLAIKATLGRRPPLQIFGT